MFPSDGVIASHTEVEPGVGNEWDNDMDEVIAHVSRVAQGGGAGWHDGGHQLADLGERWVLDVQAVCGDQVQGHVVFSG